MKLQDPDGSNGPGIEAPAPSELPDTNFSQERQRIFFQVKERFRQYFVLARDEGNLKIYTSYDWRNLESQRVAVEAALDDPEKFAVRVNKYACFDEEGLTAPDGSDPCLPAFHFQITLEGEIYTFDNEKGLDGARELIGQIKPDDFKTFITGAALDTLEARRAAARDPFGQEVVGSYHLDGNTFGDELRGYVTAAEDLLNRIRGADPETVVRYLKIVGLVSEESKDPRPGWTEKERTAVQAWERNQQNSTT